ncbi:MAG TPA: three-Cys-motif partner protein TcmP [Microthrixaceae bacterium]|nr:three-Cys-motif partner protein TcmP [Microthrixaceae bacterium]
MTRYWGFWTRGKLDLLRRYLDAFTTASKRQQEILFLDLFGGQPTNRERITEHDLDGSARIALNVADAGFSRLRFFELEPYASRLRASLETDFPGRDLQVVPGDCNLTIASTLAALAHVNWAPTFAFVDPNGPDVHWSTIEALAKFKRPGRTKTEIWLLLAAGMFIRNLRTDGTVRDVDADKLDHMYGTEQWRTIYEARVRQELLPADARDEYVNLMRWRLENVLGYAWTHPLEIFNERGHSIYYMVFATDHEVGNRIMTDLYGRAANEFPAMREAARRRRARLAEEDSGIHNLFGAELDDLQAPLGRGERLYEHSPAEPPYGSR